MNELGVYIHWPYCRSKCPYCDFYSRVDAKVDQDRLVDAYLQELDFYHNLTGQHRVRSIFFGGGTPSLLKPANIERLIDAVVNKWQTSEKPEVSLEANPNTNHPQMFADLKSAGVNRLSLGVQALNEADLRFLGRTHSLSQARQSIEEVVRIFDNHSIDLIYGRPDQKAADWEAELAEAVSFGLKHISLYMLTIEPGTYFARKGVEPLDEAAAEAMYRQTREFLTAQGYPQYEISNFARPGFESLHNLGYWRGEDYIGIGPGAHGRLRVGHSLYATEYPQKLEKLTPAERAEELILMGLRIAEGVHKERFASQCGLAWEQAADSRRQAEMVADGLLAEDGCRIRATEAGILVLDKIIEDLCL